MTYSSIIFSAVFALSACNSNQAPKENKAGTEETSAMVYACPMHPEVTGKKGDKCSKCGMELSEEVKTENKNAAVTSQVSSVNATVSIKEIVDNYLQMKNAFAKDNSNDAAAAGKALESAFKNFDKSKLTPEQKKVYDDVEDDAREHAEHIGANAGKIAHQREHFDLLSKDIYDLIKIFGATQPLYKDFCPMYNHGKGAIWISEAKEIKNPYYGKSMPGCGSVKEELK